LFRPRLIVSLVAAIPFLAFSSLPMHASSILSENFDEVPAVLGVTTAGVFSAVGNTNIDVVGAADQFAALCAGPESGNCVDMGGTGGNPVGVIDLTNPLNLAAGTYDLSFDLIGSQRGEETSTTVNFGSYSETFLLSPNDITSGIVVNQAVTITGGPTQLTFTNNGISDGNIGALLDNVSITSASPSPTPEPSSLMLLGTGILGAAGLMRRRLKA
jgi:PEP-CTERM motif